MARSSPGVARVAAILNFIADHPGQSFTLTHLVKALKLSRATCHALLAGLVDEGYLYRTSDKNYVLGPALVAIGKVAASHASPLQVAQPEMRSLADEFGVVCGAFFRDGDEIVVRDRATAVAHVGWSVPVGNRVKLRPPFGAIFLAGAPAEEVEAWLDGYAPAPTPEQRATTMAGMAFVREHGFAMIVKDAHDAGDRAPEPAFGLQAMPVPGTLLAELDRDADYAVVGLSAPVFDVGGEVAFVLSLSGFAGAMRGGEVERAGRHLREACDRVALFLTGRPRSDRPAPRA